MQAIARVNRVFRDKPAGLIVDYIGIAQNLKMRSAITQRRTSDSLALMKARQSLPYSKKYEVVKGRFDGFN